MDADSIPVVIPFVHTGMQEIMPVGTKFPKVGKQVDDRHSSFLLQSSNTDA